MARPSIKVPPAVPRGGRIAIVAPASSVRPEALDAGLARLESWGFEPRLSPGLRRRDGDLAGTIEERVADLRWALEDPSIDAVWAARGGWSSATLLEHIDWKALRKNPRWLIGFSDITALHLALWRARIAAWHAPLVADLAREERFVRRDLLEMLTAPAEERRFSFGARAVLGEGCAEGPLVGGCLSVLVSLAGTKWQPKLSGAVLFFEEVGEAPYRIDRLLWQAREAGLLDGVRGVAVGQLTACRPVPGRPSRSMRRILEDALAPLGVPVITGIPAGHGRKARALPIGYTAKLDTRRGELVLAPPGRGA